MMYKIAPLFCIAIVLNIMGCSSPPSEKLVEEKAPPSNWFFQQRAFPNNDINPSYIQEGLAYKTLLEAQRSPSIFDKPWTPIGPSNIGGRITDLEMWPDDLNTILAGSASGGIFKSDDQGNSFKPIFDEAMSLSIGDIEISKSNPNIIYVGTGEANAGGGSLTYDGMGVYKSEDRGEEWKPVGLEKMGSIGKVIVHPKDEKTVWVATMGRLFSPNPERGVYKTTDGGDTWKQVLFVSDSTGAIDLAIHPTQPDTIYAAMWERTRRVNTLNYGGASSGIFRSYDGGDTWIKLETGLQLEDKGRIALAISPSQPKTIYTHIADAIGFSRGFYVSNDHGESWEARTTSGVDNVSYQWWFSKLFVHPEIPESIYFTSLNMYQSHNGGQSWNRIFNNAHLDHHALYIHPLNPDFVINGNDGGINISADGGRDHNKVKELSNIQFYTCAIDPHNVERVFGGTQDNGTLGNIGDQENTWEHFLGGDGFRVAFDPINPGVFYAESQNGTISKTIDDGFSFDRVGREITGRKNWNTPIEIDPINPNYVYTGTEQIWRSTDAGENFQPISTDLTNGPYPGNRDFGTITTIEVVPKNNQIIYAGTDDGKVWNSLDGGNTWNDITPPMRPRWTTSVLPHPTEEHIAFVSFSGFRFDSNDGHIYKTEDFGNTWTDITGDLPDVPINDIQVDLNEQGLLFAATDIGVFYSANEGVNWNILGTALPNVPITDLDIEPNGKLVAATYGRSMYYYIVDEISSAVDLSIELDIYPNPSADDIYFNSNDPIDRVDILSIQGQHITTFQGIQQSKISIRHLEDGYYLLKFWSGDRFRVLKFLKY